MSIVQCEGSGHEAHQFSPHNWSEGMCRMCGRVVAVDDECIAETHTRIDIEGMVGLRSGALRCPKCGSDDVACESTAKAHTHQCASCEYETRGRSLQ